MKYTRVGVLGIALVLVAAGVGPAFGDEKGDVVVPGDLPEWANKLPPEMREMLKGPVPKEMPAWADKLPPEAREMLARWMKERRAKEAAAAKTGETPPWSTPTAPPVGQSGGDALPPPRVIVRRGSLPNAPTDVEAAALERRIKDVADRPLTPTIPAIRRPPPGRTAPAASTPPGLPAIKTNPNQIHSIGKTHNLEQGTEGDLFLQLDIQYELHGQAGRAVHVGVWFARVDTGKYLESTMQEYADPKGHITVQTQAGRVRGNSARFAAALRIPYRAFPVKPEGEEYDVEARVEILRGERGGKVSVLCLGTTTFRVYGEAEQAPAEESEAPHDEGGDGDPIPDAARQEGMTGPDDAAPRDLPTFPPPETPGGG